MLVAFQWNVAFLSAYTLCMHSVWNSASIDRGLLELTLVSSEYQKLTKLNDLMHICIYVFMHGGFVIVRNNLVCYNVLVFIPVKW